jgi:hypothetical protein
MFIIILSIVIGVVLVALSGRSYRDNAVTVTAGFTGQVMIWLPVILCLISICISMPISLKTISNCQSFKERNQDVISTLMVKYPEAAMTITRDNSTQINNLSYEYVKKITAYNDTVLWYKNYQNHWFLGFFVGQMPESVDFIEVPKS